MQKGKPLRKKKSKNSDRVSGGKAKVLYSEKVRYLTECAAGRPKYQRKSQICDGVSGGKANCEIKLREGGQPWYLGPAALKCMLSISLKARNLIEGARKAERIPPEVRNLTD